MADAIHQTSSIVCQKDDGAPGKAGNITSATRPRQPLHFIVAVTPGSVQVAETVNFGSAQKAHVDTALLKKTHNASIWPHCVAPRILGGSPMV